MEKNYVLHHGSKGKKWSHHCGETIGQKKGWSQEKR